MEDSFNRDNREDVYSLVVRAGKRTYFFDVKETRGGEKYLTITESKRRFSADSGKFFYEKHKIFLYKEDFEKFTNGLDGVIGFINTGQKPEIAAAPFSGADDEDYGFGELKADHPETEEDQA